MAYTTQTEFHSTAATVTVLPAPLDLMAAHLAVHALNGALLELAKASIGLTVGDTASITDGTAEVWTATLRSDVDGPGGAYRGGRGNSDRSLSGFSA